MNNVFKSLNKNKFTPIDLLLKGVYADNKMFSVECKFDENEKTVVTVKYIDANVESTFEADNDLSIDNLLLIVDEKIDELFYKIN